MHGGMKVYAARRPRPGSTWRQSEDEPTTTTSPRAPGSPAATRDDQGRQRKKSFARKGNANRHAATVEADKVRGTYIEPSKITVAEYARGGAETRPHRPTTARRTENDDPVARRGNASRWPQARGRASVRGPGLGHRPVESAGADHCAAGRRAASERVRGRGPRQARGRIPCRPHPAPSVRESGSCRCRSSRSRPSRRPCQSAIGPWSSLRLRSDSGSASCWPSASRTSTPCARTVRIEWQFTQGSNGERSEPKIPRSKRTVPLPRVVADALAAHLAAYPAAEDGTIFTTGKGTRSGTSTTATT